MVLELASELITDKGWFQEQAKVTLRPQGPGPWEITLYASDSADAIDEVARGETHLAIVNPGAILTLATKGTGPFKEPIPLRAITVIGSYDQLALGVREDAGINSLEEIRDKKYPLAISVRGQRDHTIHLVLDEVFKALGFSTKDLESWGGKINFDDGLPYPHRVASVAEGKSNALFDEAAVQWVDHGLEVGMKLLPIAEQVLQKLEEVGFRRGVIEAKDYENLAEDVQTIDYSGFIVYTHENTPDDVVSAICGAIDRRQDRIPQDKGPGQLELDRMCRDTPEGPLDIPLHRAAEAYWKEHGYLK
jgi:TRAP-type uncharacterized transport system substrate-binding protein